MNTRSIINTLLAITLTGLFVSCSPSKQNESYQMTANSNQASILNGVNSTTEYQKNHGIVGIYLLVKGPKGQDGGAICTGTLIRPNVVLTAAHCIASSPEMRLVGGMVFFTNDMETAIKEMDSGKMDNLRTFAKFKIHERYDNAQTDDQSNHDVGLIRLSSDAPADFKVATILPANLKAKLVPDALLMLSGYGVNTYTKKPGTEDEFDGAGDGILRQVSGIKLTDISSNGEELALDQTKGGACHGDSGGPAFLTVPATATETEKTFLVGVTSRGEEPCNKVSIYSSTLGYTDWINTTLVALLK